jgi:hypothetical protein
LTTLAAGYSAPVRTLERIDELTELLDLGVPLYLRYSPGPAADAAHPSVDHESGLPMPGHSANPLRPPGWWTRPPADWLARRICQYLQKLEEGVPDNEPLLVHVQPIAWLAPELLAEAHRRYQDSMDAGRARPR